VTVSLLVPIEPDGGERDRNWRWLRSRYQRLFPGWEIVERGCSGGWSKGEAVNAAAQAASGEVLVIADADLLLARDGLTEALVALKRGAPWVVPHGRVLRLTEACTAKVLAGDMPAFPAPLESSSLARPSRLGPAGGGVTVLRREAFHAVGGIDPDFTGWGGEDISFARALDTLVGPHRRLGALAWHLWHPPMERRLGNRASSANERLAARYLDAVGDPISMAALVAR
jgi:GT2 family glycosyltransferase